jgi:hypothetical protein
MGDGVPRGVGGSGRSAGSAIPAAPSTTSDATARNEAPDASETEGKDEDPP